MEPTDNLSGGHSHSWDYGFPAGTFNQLDQEEDLMSSPFMLFDSSPPPSLGLPHPSAEGFAAPEIFAEETNYDAAPTPLVAIHGTGPASPIPGHQIPMEPTNNLSGGGGHSHGGDYGCAAWTFDQEQGEDLMSSQFLLPESHSPQPSWPLRSMPPAEGFAAPENFIDGQTPPLDEMPSNPAAVAEETNCAAALPGPLVATHGTRPGQLSSNSFSLSSTTSHECDEEEVQQTMRSLLPPPMAPNGLSNNTNGGPAVRSHVDAVPLVQHGTSTTADETTPHPQQQLPLPTNNPEAQPGGLDLSLVDEVQIQQTTPVILPSHPPSHTPAINLGPDKANHAASAPMGSQETLIPAAPQDQEANILGHPNQLQLLLSQDGPANLLPMGKYMMILSMGMDMMLQLGRHIAEMKKDEENRSSKVWQHFQRTPPCKYCRTVRVICPYCLTFTRSTSTINLLRHLESIHQLPASSGAQSSQAIQITEITENNPNGESEEIGTDDSNKCATAARVDTQGTNAVVLSPWQQHQPLMDRNEQMATILSSQPCCKQPGQIRRVVDMKYVPILEPDPWCDLITRLSDGSYCSATNTSTQEDGFRLKFYDNTAEEGHKIVPAQQGVQVLPSAAWMHVSMKPYKKHAGISLATGSNTIGSSYLYVGVEDPGWVPVDEPPALDGCDPAWQSMYDVFCSLGLKKQIARDLVMHASGWVNGCNLRLRRPSCSEKGKSIVEQAGDESTGKRKRKAALPRSKVWNHFTKEVVEAEGGSMVTMARCNHCGSELRADSARHGTSQLKRHLRSTHQDELAKSPL